MQQALIAFASSRLALIVTGYLALTLFPAHPVESWQGLAFPGNNWIDGWVRWDSMWYEAIVDRHPRFLPGLPFERQLLSVLFVGVVDRVAAVSRVPDRGERVLYRRADRVVGVVSARADGGRSVGHDAGGRDVAARTVWLMAVFPFSFFLTAVYADALYFCLARGR